MNDDGLNDGMDSDYDYDDYDDHDFHRYPPAVSVDNDAT